MITLPTLTPQERDLLKGKQVVICGYTDQAQELHEILQSVGIQVVAFWSDALTDCLKRPHKGVPIVNKKQLQVLAKQQSNIMVMSLSFDKIKLDQLEQTVQKMGLIWCTVPIGKLRMAFAPAYVLQKIKQNNDTAQWEQDCHNRTSTALARFVRKGSRNAVFLCLPPKTGDYSLEHTFAIANQLEMDHGIDNRLYERLSGWNNKLFKRKNGAANKAVHYLIDPLDKVGKNVEHINLRHRPRMINREKLQRRYQTVKIITAVREPIAQNLLMTFQDLSTGSAFRDWMLGKMAAVPQTEQTQVIHQLETLFLKHGDDVQMLFEAFVDRYVAHNKTSALCRSIQRFFPEFQNYVVDITAYPFDQQKGYSIIKEGNLEVFVYQLEKLDQIAPALSDWVGAPFDQIVRGNDATDKWIADSYKQAQRDIQFSQEYFDDCFNQPYVQHCYAQADIEKFKEKWRGHIK